MSATALQQFLHNPAERTDLAGLCQAWRQVDISLRCQVRAPATLGPETAWLLPGKLRGAWGQQLMRSASPEALAGRPCPWSPPCALEALFRPQGSVAGGLELPRPYVLAVSLDPGRRGLSLRLSLFGAATEYALAAAEAYSRALSEGSFHLADAPLSLEVLGRDIVPLDGPGLAPLDGPEVSLTARLRFLTPLCQRRGDDLVLDPSSLITGLANRLSGLARWHGLELMEDWRALKDTAQGLQWEMQGGASVNWMRRSNRQQGRDIPMTGLLGDLYLRGNLPALAPLLALGRRCHAGGHTAQGLGRYELEWM